MRRDEQEVQSVNQNFSMVFGENFRRFIGEIDKALLYVRGNINSSQGTPDFSKIVHSADLISEFIVQVSVIDAKGILRASTAGEQPAPPIDLSDREHFRAQVNATEDNIFIGKPLIGRASQAWSIQFSRRFLNPDQTFAGVVVASLKPSHLIAFYDRLHFLAPTSISIIGEDGIVRASGGSIAGFKLGEDLRATPLYKQIQLGKNTNFEDSSYNSSSRLTNLHHIGGTTFWVAVSSDQALIHSNTMDDLKQDSFVALILSLLVILAVYHLLKSEMTARKKAEQLKLTLENMTQGIMLVTAERTVPIINKKSAELFALPDTFLKSIPQFRTLVRQQVRAGKGKLMVALLEAINNNRHQQLENAEYISTSEHVMPDKSVVEQRVVQLPDDAFICTFTDITARWNAENQAARLACEDALTGLFNRRGFYQAMSEPSLHNQPIALLFLDLDRFKVINDTLGHRIGDLLLRDVANRLRLHAGARTIIARLGGDEFALIVRDFDHKDQLETLTKDLVEAIAKPYSIEGQIVCTSASAGIAMRSPAAESGDELLIAADLALYAVKISSRGSCKFFDASMMQELNERRKLEMDLRTAIANQDLRVHYQPVIGLQSGRIEGFEALVRWPHKTRGMVPPIDFITVAEDSELILQLTEWVMMEACREATKWDDSIMISVNLSPVSFNDVRLLEKIQFVLTETGLAPHRLELEITEQTCMTETDRTLVTLQGLKHLGIKIALDDFGTGYSSLSYLRKFPFDKIKVDRSFISGLERGDHEQITIVQAIISIARAFGMKVTAEGIETVEQRDFLSVLGCDLVQGFLFSKAISSELLPEFMDKWSPSLVLAA